jgi:hypothetical protein
VCQSEIKLAHTDDEVRQEIGVGKMRPTECTVRGDGASLLTERCGIMAQTPQGALLGRLGCLSVICLPQSSACQRSLVEVRPTIPVCTLVGSVGLCVRLDCPVHQTLSAVPQRDEFFVGQWRRQIGVHFPNMRLRRCRSSQSSSHNQTDPLPGFPSGRLTSSNVATWVLSNQDSSVAPQTLQDA